MTHRRHRHWSSCRPECTCAFCAELDLSHPGEGRQLALPVGDTGALPPAPMLVLAAQERVS